MGADNKDIEDFLNDDFFDDDIQYEIRKDEMEYIRKENQLKNEEIEINERKIDSINETQLRGLLGFS